MLFSIAIQKALKKAKTRKLTKKTLLARKWEISKLKLISTKTCT